MCSSMNEQSVVLNAAASIMIQGSAAEFWWFGCVVWVDHHGCQMIEALEFMCCFLKESLGRLLPLLFVWMSSF